LKYFHDGIFNLGTFTTIGAFQTWDTTYPPSYSASFGMLTPGGSIGHDGIISTYSIATGWVERVRVASDTGVVTIPGSSTYPSLIVGVLEFQSYSLNNAWVAQNAYFNGSVWKYRASSSAQQVYLNNDVIQLNVASTGSAGATLTWITGLQINADGKIWIPNGISDNTNIAVGSTNGTMIATSATQKLGFWGTTPIVQPTSGTVLAALKSMGLIGGGRYKQLRPILLQSIWRALVAGTATPIFPQTIRTMWLRSFPPTRPPLNRWRSAGVMGQGLNPSSLSLQIRPIAIC
jgi:hypothetical protein